MKPYLVTSCSYCLGVNRWLATLRGSRVVEQVRTVVIMYEPHFSVPEQFIVHKERQPYPGLVGRYERLLEIIPKLGEDNWYIWTDAADVVFQSPLPDFNEFPESAEVVLCNENVKHEDSYWREWLSMCGFSWLHGSTVFNAGCFAMKGSAFLGFVRVLLDQAIDGMDQVIFNKWLREAGLKTIIVPRLFLALYATFTGVDWPSSLQGQDLALIREGVFVDIGQRPFSIVHGNGSSKIVLDSVVGIH